MGADPAEPGAGLALPPRVVVPLTGEVIETNDLPAVAAGLDTIRAYRQRLQEAARVLGDAFVAESRRQGTRTFHEAGLVVTVGPDVETGYDVTVLVELLGAGLPPERYADLVTEEIQYRVNQRVVRQLELASPAYAEIIARARVRTPKPQTVGTRPDR